MTGFHVEIRHHFTILEQGQFAAKIGEAIGGGKTFWPVKKTLRVCAFALKILCVRFRKHPQKIGRRAA